MYLCPYKGTSTDNINSLSSYPKKKIYFLVIWNFKPDSLPYNIPKMHNIHLGKCHQHIYKQVRVTVSLFVQVTLPTQCTNIKMPKNVSIPAHPQQHRNTLTSGWVQVMTVLHSCQVDSQGQKNCAPHQQLQAYSDKPLPFSISNNNKKKNNWKANT